MNKKAAIVVAAVAVAVTIYLLFLMGKARPTLIRPFPVGVEMREDLKIGEGVMTVVTKVSKENEGFKYSYKLTYDGPVCYLHWDHLAEVFGHSVFFEMSPDAKYEFETTSKFAPTLAKGEVRVLSKVEYEQAKGGSAWEVHTFFGTGPIPVPHASNHVPFE